MTRRGARAALPRGPAAAPVARGVERAAALVLVLALASAVGAAGASSGCLERGHRQHDGGQAGARAAGATPERGSPRASDPARPGPELTGDPPGPADRAATVRIALEAEPANLNPLIAADQMVARVALGDIYQGLLCPGATGRPAHLCLADHLDVDLTGRVWAFRLRRGVLWHDGQRFTGDDVRFTFNLLRGARQAPTVLAAELDDLTSVAVHGRDVVLTFAGFRPTRREDLAHVPILPRHAFAGVRPAELAASPASRAPVGTGPLRLVAWHRGQAIELERFAHYWGRPAGAARVVWQVEPGRARALLDLAAGRIDVVPGVPVEQARAAAARSPARVRVFSYALPAYLAAVINLRRPPLSDVRVRRALVMSLDRRAVIDALLGGGPILTGPYLPGDPAGDPGVEPWPHDPAGAAQLVREARAAGGGPGRPRVTLSVPAGSRTMARIADVWASDARATFDLRVAEVPYAELLQRARAGRFEVALLSFTSGPDLDLYPRFHSSEIGGENYGGVRDAALDALVEQFRREPGAAARQRLSRAIHRRLHQLVPYVFIAADRRQGLAARDVGGVAAASSGGGARALWRAGGARGHPGAR